MAGSALSRERQHAGRIARIEHLSGREARHERPSVRARRSTLRKTPAAEAAGAMLGSPRTAVGWRRPDMQVGRRHVTPLASLVLGGLLVGAAIVRIAGVLAPHLDDDEEWIGTAALNVLRGVFPPFIYGIPYQGSVGLFLHAVGIEVAGPTPWALKILPVLSGLAFVGLTLRLARRLFDRETAWAAALVAAFPAAPLLELSLNARYYHALVPVLGSLVLLAGLAARERRGPAERAGWLVFGLLSGLAFWTSYDAVIYPAAVALLLAATDVRRARAVGPWCILGFLLGSLPLWAYNLRAGVLF